VVAMSVLSGCPHDPLPRVQALLDEAGADDILLTGGGIIPEDDVKALLDQGIGRLFGPGTPTSAAIAYIRQWFASPGRPMARGVGRTERAASASALRRALRAPDHASGGGRGEADRAAARPGEAHGPGADRRPPGPGKPLGRDRAPGGPRPYDGQAPAAGVVTGVGRVEGREVVVVANDATVKAGSWWPETITKILRAQEIAMRCRIPIIYLVDSAGVNLPYQGGVFPGQYGAARIFYYNSIMRRYLRIPQLAAVMGPCIAGGAYLPPSPTRSSWWRGRASWGSGARTW
jgi:hypothetical protein